MIKKIKDLTVKYSEIIRYLITGFATTVIDYIVYVICYDLLRFNVTISTALAWIAAVIFAFITNKLWVFKSKRADSKSLIKEVTGFFGARVMTGILEVVLMTVTVDMLGWEAHIMKIAVGVLVTILNYVASKLFIFAGDKNDNK